jgi:fatty-acyl-CoA synthase
LRGRLADYKIPSAYHFISVLDRNPAGKVLRRVLRERLLTEPPGRVVAGSGRRAPAEN